MPSASAEDLEETIAGIRRALQAANAPRPEAAEAPPASRRPPAQLVQNRQAAATRGAPPARTLIPARAQGHDQLDLDIERLRHEKAALEREILQTERRNLSQGRSSSSAVRLDETPVSETSHDGGGIHLFPAASAYATRAARPTAQVEQWIAPTTAAPSLSLSQVERPVSSMIPQAPLPTGMAERAMLDTRRSLPSFALPNTWDERAESERTGYHAHVTNGHHEDKNLIRTVGKSSQRSAPIQTRRRVASDDNFFSGVQDFRQQMHNADMMANSTAENTAPQWATGVRERKRSQRQGAEPPAVDVKHLYPGSERDSDSMPLMTIYDAAQSGGSGASREGLAFPSNSARHTSAPGFWPEDKPGTTPTKRIWQLVPHGRQSAPDMSGEYDVTHDRGKNDENVFSDYDVQPAQNSTAPRLLERAQKSHTVHAPENQVKSTSKRPVRLTPKIASFSVNPDDGLRPQIQQPQPPDSLRSGPSSSVAQSSHDQNFESTETSSKVLVTCTSLFSPLVSEEPHAPTGDQKAERNLEWLVQVAQRSADSQQKPMPLVIIRTEDTDQVSSLL
jgi:hypothetical protein